MQRQLSFGKTRLSGVGSRLTQSTTEVRLNGKAIGLVISRENPSVAGSVECRVQIEGEPSVEATTLSSAKAIARQLAARK